ncbi:MAG: hypothetical protein OEX02_09345 [Cyclobacteriaceae bacterium]|nr:hypothetical protein [Cyclobacteriaceae bacterium]
MQINRVLKLFWLVSFMLVNLVLFYVYAWLPEMVAYSGDYATATEYISKEIFFYFFLGLIALTNITIYIFARNWNKNASMSRQSIRLTGWKHGLAVVVNIFLAISMVFVSVFNSGEKFDYSNFGYLVYFSLGLVILWIVCLPLVIYSARVRFK